MSRDLLKVEPRSPSKRKNLDSSKLVKPKDRSRLMFHVGSAFEYITDDHSKHWGPSLKGKGEKITLHLKKNWRRLSLFGKKRAKRFSLWSI